MRTTPWAAMLHDHEFCYTGDLSTAAIAECVEEEWANDAIVPAVYTVHVYEAAEWCDGSDDECEECECSGDHDEYDSIMLGWKGKERLEIVVSVDGDGDVQWTFAPPKTEAT